MWSDGTTLWVSGRDYQDDKFYAYRLSDGTREAAEGLRYGLNRGRHHGNAEGMWSDGVTLWVVGLRRWEGVCVQEYPTSRATQTKDYELRLRGEHPSDSVIWSDGVTLYVAVSKGNRIEAYYSIDPGAKLSAHYVKATTATLYVGGHNAAWWYERTAPTGDATCHRVAAGTKTASLSSLTASASYTYKAYDKAGCNAADELATVTFTTAAS